MNGFRHTALTWHSPILVPAYALLASLVLTLGVGRFAGAAPPANPAPAPATSTAAPSTPAASAPASSTALPTDATTAPLTTGTEAPFVAADKGRPEFRLTLPPDAPDPTPKYQWKVLVRSFDPKRPGFNPLNAGADLPPNGPMQTQESLVDRLLCVSAASPGWTVTVPPAVPNVTPSSEDPKITACQGGWADGRAVPKTLTFVAKKAL